MNYEYRKYLMKFIIIRESARERARMGTNIYTPRPKGEYGRAMCAGWALKKGNRCCTMLRVPILGRVGPNYHTVPYIGHFVLTMSTGKCAPERERVCGIGSASEESL